MRQKSLDSLDLDSVVFTFHVATQGRKVMWKNWARCHMMSGTGEQGPSTSQHHHQQQQAPVSSATYMFPSATEGGGTAGTPRVAVGLPQQARVLRGHTRSASHGAAALPATLQLRAANAGGGGITADSMGSIGAAATTRPSALKKGHQRAFSHGQIGSAGSSGESGVLRGHNRVGSRTEFILPPGHRDEPSRPRTESSILFKPGHSRQASRSESIYTLRNQAPPKWTDKLFFWRRRAADDLSTRVRTVFPNHAVPANTSPLQHPNRSFPSNEVRTTKYTMLSFLPKNLFEQFHRVANLYFLFIVLLNWFPAINAFGKEIAMIPVAFVLGVTAIKDAFEDRRRHNSDKRINNSTCRVYN
ncbi:hypothetical protein B566_EDAN001756, partial [Ephemera danica]